MGQWLEYSGIMVPLKSNLEDEEADSLRERFCNEDFGINYEGSLLFSKDSTDERFDIYDEGYESFDGRGKKVDMHIKFTGEVPVSKKELTRLRKTTKENGLVADFERARFFSALHYDTVDNPCDMVELKVFESAKDNEVISKFP